MKTSYIDMAIVEQKANEKFWSLTMLAQRGKSCAGNALLF